VIGIDASRLTVSRLTGTETYTWQLLRAFASLEVTDEIELYLNASAAPAALPAAGDPVCIPFPRLWTHLRLSAEMLRRRPRVLFVPAHVVPAIHPRTVVTIHDLGYIHHPEAHPPAARRVLDLSTRWSAFAARRIIAISGHTKRDLIRAYRIPEEKIAVIHHGVGAGFRPQPGPVVSAVKERHRLVAPYVLAVGTVQPRKNLARLASAVGQLNRQGTGIDLVLAGTKGWLAEDVLREIEQEGATPFVKLLGYVADADLPALYTGAAVFAMPSLYEGFGMPVLEAMACGTPVVAADRAALPEVAGDAAVLCDPFDVRSLAAALASVFSDADRRQTLIARGHERATHFSWEATARQTLDVLRRERDS